MSGRVVHVLSGMPYDLYVGRPVPRYRLKGSVLANPHRIGPDLSREEALRRFEVGLRAAMETDPVWQGRVADVAGLVLACWCAPKDGFLTVEDPIICHGQVILRLAGEASEPQAAVGGSIAVILERVNEKGQIAVRRPPDGRELAVVPQIFNAMLTISYRDHEYGYDESYDYEAVWEAIAALRTWNPETEPEPPEGWTRHKPSNRRRPGGDPSREYVAP